MLQTLGVNKKHPGTLNIKDGGMELGKLIFAKFELMLTLMRELRDILRSGA